MSESLLNEIRATKPVAPSALRDRVRALSAAEPARQPFLARFRMRQLVLVAPVALVLALSAATVIGLTREDVTGGDQITASGAGEATTRATAPGFERAQPQQSEALKGLAAPPATADSSGAVPPATGQLQRYEAELRLRVDDVDALSGATKSAQRIALSHGGSIASLQYEAPSVGIGSAQITLRIPISKVQSAMTSCPHSARSSASATGSRISRFRPTRSSRRSRRRSGRSQGSWASSRARPSPTRTAPC